MGDARAHPDAVLFDRDGTLVVDVPYNGDPTAVEALPSARTALSRLRRAGIALGVVSNQSGIGRGILTHAQVQSVNTRIDSLLGSFDVWEYCPHLPDAGCDCRKPRPGLIERACRELGVNPSRVVVIGDIGTDVAAAQSAGCTAILVPTSVTKAEEIVQAPFVANDLLEAADLILSGALIDRSRS